MISIPNFLLEKQKRLSLFLIRDSRNFLFVITVAFQALALLSYVPSHAHIPFRYEGQDTENNLLYHFLYIENYHHIYLSRHIGGNNKTNN